MSAQFLIGVFVPTESLAEPLHQLLAQKRFVVSWSRSASEFIDWVVSNRHRIDCLIVELTSDIVEAFGRLKQRDILLPTLAVASTNGSISIEVLCEGYHDAVTALDVQDLSGVDGAVRLAVEQYLELPAAGKMGEPLASELGGSDRDKRLFLLSLQQQRLAEKLKERLGYVGVYYKRNSQNFLRQMSVEERQEFLEKLRQDYRHIILNYFSNDSAINQKIDDFVNVAFFADMSVPKIVEIHMELIDDFSKQLQLEGRNEEILTDYRLTLIDVIAHLCEMYRRSVPRG
ncbi:MAG: circadian clock protein KaiA [Cyanobacteria bacterium P01_D01_bin.36]